MKFKQAYFPEPNNVQLAKQLSELQESNRLTLKANSFYVSQNTRLLSENACLSNYFQKALDCVDKLRVSIYERDQFIELMDTLLENTKQFLNYKVENPFKNLTNSVIHYSNNEETRPEKARDSPMKQRRQNKRTHKQVNYSELSPPKEKRTSIEVYEFDEENISPVHDFRSKRKTIYRASEEINILNDDDMDVSIGEADGNTFENISDEIKNCENKLSLSIQSLKNSTVKEADEIDEVSMLNTTFDLNKSLLKYNPGEVSQTNKTQTTPTAEPEAVTMQLDDNDSRCNISLSKKNIDEVNITFEFDTESTVSEVIPTVVAAAELNKVKERPAKKVRSLTKSTKATKSVTKESAVKNNKEHQGGEESNPTEMIDIPSSIDECADSFKQKSSSHNDTNDGINQSTQSLQDAKISVIESSGRQRRSRAQISYKLPSMGKKVRQGDSDWCRK